MSEASIHLKGDAKQNPTSESMHLTVFGKKKKQAIN